MPFWSCSVQPCSCCSPLHPRRTRRRRSASPSPAPCSRRPGAPGDWDPACAVTHLSYDASDDVWQGTFSLPAGSYEYKAALNDSLDGELRPARAVERGEHPPEPAVGRHRQVLLRPQVALGHRQPKLGDRGRAGELPVRARLPGRLGPELPALVARGPRRRRHLHVRDDGPAGRLVRDEGRDQRGLGRELRPGRRPRRRQHPVQRPRRQHEGDLQLRRRLARADGDRRDPGRRPGWPGALSHFDLARKDCLGTARNTTSKVWYTVATAS